MIVYCPKCSEPMRNVTALMMGPSYNCEECDIDIWNDNGKLKQSIKWHPSDGKVHLKDVTEQCLK
jgi:hypothetical protein